MSVRRALAWTFVGQLFLFVVQFGGSVIVARLLSPYEIGIFAVAMATVGLISTIQSFGLANYIVREATIDEPTLRTAFTINAILSAILAAAIVAGGFIASRFLDEEAVGQVMSLIAVSALFAILEFRPRAMLQRTMDFRPIALIQATRALITTSIVVTLAYRGYSYMSPAWGVVAGAAFAALAFTVAGRRHVGFGCRLAGWRTLTGFGMRMAAIGGVWALSTRLSEIVLARLLGLAALGLYSRASNIITLFWDNVYNVVTSVLFSRLSQEYRLKGSLREAYLKSLAIITAVMWPALAGLAVLARPVVFHLYGTQWIGAADPLSVLAIAYLILVSMTMTWEIFVIRDETSRQARFEFAKSGVGFVAFTLGSTIGITAAAGARIIEAVFAFVLYRPHVNRMTGTTAREFTAIYVRSGLLTAAAIAPAVLLMATSGWGYDVAIWKLAVAIVAGAGCWLALSTYFQHFVIDEIRRALGHLRLGRLRNA